MLLKKIKIAIVIALLYQTTLYSKSNSFEYFNSKNLSEYFSGIVAFENKDNSRALNFFDSSKVLINKHDPYLKRYIYALVLENKVQQAINLIKKNYNKNNSNFFDAQLLLVLDSLKKNELNRAEFFLDKATSFSKKDRFNLAIIENLKQYIFVFKEKKLQKNKSNFGKLSIISETFQRCYLDDQKTDSFFSNLINSSDADYTRYIFFYLSHLIQNNELDKTKEIVN